MSQKRGLSLIEYLRLAETNPQIDKEVDDNVIKMAKEKDNLIIDSRVAWHFIPNSLKIYLKTDEKEGAKRIFEEILKKNNRNETKKPPASADYIIKKIRERKKTDDKRYMKYYGINIRDKNNYDFILDTTSLNPGQVFEKVMEFIKSKMDAESN